MAEINKTIDFLVKVPLFQGLNRRQLERLSRRFVDRNYDKGAIIVTQGSGGEGFFIIESGKAEVTRTRSDGVNVIVNQLGPSDFFGELALLDDGLRTASITACEPTHCLVLTRWDFLGILKDDAEMAVVILQELAKRFRKALDAL
jgi:CRP-like cAMP-binding protein